MEHKHDTGISRRGFLSGAAVSGALLAAGAMTGCAPALRNEGSKVKAKNEAASAAASADAGTPDWLGEAPAITDAQCKEVLDFEVCVIGAGTSGYFAACAAAEDGLKTILIEKSASGNNIRSSSLGAVGTKAQKKIGAEAKIDPMDIVNDMDHYALGQVSSSLIRKWALNSGEAIDWYTEVLAKGKFEVQLEYNMPKGTRYKEWPTGHGTNGEYPSREGDVAKYLDKYILSFDGCEERFLTPMRRLITDESGRVVGVYAEGPDGMIRINASKGVIVATGGYASNQDMYKTLQPTRYSCLGTFDAFPSCTGDGIKALLWLGAKLDDVHTSLTFNRCLLTADQKTGDPYNVGADNYGYHFFASQPFLRVDAHGKRFHNESAPYDFVMSALSKHPEDERYWHQVWDSNWKKDNKTIGDLEKSSRSQITIESIALTSVRTIEWDDDVSAAVDLMAEEKISTLPVLEGKELVGIITEYDIIELLSACRERDMMFVQISGLDDNEKNATDAIYADIEEMVKKISKIYKPESLTMHVSRYNDTGGNFKYSISARLFIDGTAVMGKQVGWDLVQTASDLIEKLEDAVINMKDSKVTFRKRKK